VRRFCGNRSRGARTADAGARSAGKGLGLVPCPRDAPPARGSTHGRTLPWTVITSAERWPGTALVGTRRLAHGRPHLHSPRPDGLESRYAPTLVRPVRCLDPRGSGSGAALPRRGRAPLMGTAGSPLFI